MQEDVIDKSCNELYIKSSSDLVFVIHIVEYLVIMHNGVYEYCIAYAYIGR